MVELILYIIIALYVWEYLLTTYIDYLNTKNWSTQLPKEAKWIYDKKEYTKSMEYEKTNHIFSKYSWWLMFVIMLILLSTWSFWILYDYVWKCSDSEIVQTLYFFWVIFIAQTIISLPFSYYQTFVIEEKFGFNKMTKKLFFIDTIKSIVMTVLIWGAILALITWIYTLTQENFWLYTWWVLTFITLFMMMFYTSLIVPIFNKLTPLKKGLLRNSIEKFASKVWFHLDNIYVIDWSKRSSKANAYFSGFWPKKTIVLYDTLIKDLTTWELVWVLAHEIWHYKRKHTLQMLAYSVAQTWVMLYVLGLVLQYPEVSQALWAIESSFAVGMLAFWILFTPISIIFWLIWNVISRKNEYQADEFAWINHNPAKLVAALKKLTKTNLGNLRPHPVYEFFHYSHPTVLKRIEALEKLGKK